MVRNHGPLPTDVSLRSSLLAWGGSKPTRVLGGQTGPRSVLCSWDPEMKTDAGGLSGFF